MNKTHTNNGGYLRVAQILSIFNRQMEGTMWELIVITIVCLALFIPSAVQILRANANSRQGKRG